MINNCPLCRSEKDKAYADKHNYTLELCDDCKLKRLNNKINRTPEEEKFRLAIIAHKQLKQTKGE